MIIILMKQMRRKEIEPKEVDRESELNIDDIIILQIIGFY